MSDYTINQIHVQDVPGLDAPPQPTVPKRVTFMVGKKGPFTLTYSPKDYSAERVQGDMHKEVEALQAIMGGA